MPKSVVDIAIANLDAKIAELQRAKDILTTAVVNTNPAPGAPRKPRGRPKKAVVPPDAL